MKNLEYVSYIKNWTMILVVLYHCLCGYSNIWGEEYSWKLVPIWSNLAHILVYFHMPIFTLMSAYLYAYLEANQTYNNTSVFIEKKIKRIMVPYLIWGTIVCLIQQCDFYYLFFGISHLWYLLFLFEAFISFYLINKIPNKCKIIVFALLFVTCLLIYKKNNTPILCIGYYIRYMPYFIIGYYLYHIIRKIKSIKCIYAFSIAMVFLMLFIIEFLNHSNKFILAALSLIVIISILIILRQKEKILLFKRYILKLNKYTMGVYIIHHIIIQEINNSTIGRLYMEYYVLYPILLFILSFVFSLMLTYILQKWKIGRVLFGY